MFEAIVSDVFRVMRGTFFSGDLISISIALGSVFVAALLMKRAGQGASMTLLALALFAAAGLVRGLFRAPAQEAGLSGGRVAGQLEQGWASFAALSAGTLLAYFLAFLLVILAIFAVRILIDRH